jgi:hypothetical protein
MDDRDVFASGEPDACWFAVAPRFVPESALDVNLDEQLQDATHVLDGCPVEFDASDADVQGMFRTALLASGLLRETDDGDRFDSFAGAHHYEGVCIRVVQNWESGLVDQPVSGEVRGGIVSGLTPEQTSLVCQQVTLFRGNEFTEGDLEELISGLTPSNAHEFAREFRLMAFTRQQPLEALLLRLEDLARSYNL